MAGYLTLLVGGLRLAVGDFGFSCMMVCKMFFPLTILLTLSCKSFAIQCFYCTSANNTACLDPMKYDPETRALVIPIIRCEDTRVLNVENYNFFCRKIIQTVYIPHREAQVRVTRGCGWIQNEKPCYRANTHDHLETACQCFSDYCNSAVSVIPTSGKVLSIVVTFALYLFG
ncbi:unnamed protein product [Arctia plantaginis]|uniref:Protein sleepless n=1 Tax=Arctia plantaginis TaxID=874455 RepID=A0A8S1AYE2_ARCPL|nr:unnamed protein product [Arctia plantaginis]CAB3251668.1 unnamed protein product [Arctia plantaginis]